LLRLHHDCSFNERNQDLPARPSYPAESAQALDNHALVIADESDRPRRNDRDRDTNDYRRRMGQPSRQ
jgi:hypothetical protein